MAYSLRTVTFVAETADPLAYSVDRDGIRGGGYNWTVDGNFTGKETKFHRHVDGDCLAVCSSRILTNWPDEPGENPDRLTRDDLCRRCFPDSLI